MLASFGPPAKRYL